MSGDEVGDYYGIYDQDYYRLLYECSHQLGGSIYFSSQLWISLSFQGFFDRIGVSVQTIIYNEVSTFIGGAPHVKERAYHHNESESKQ